MLDTVVRKLIEWQYERALRQLYLGNSLKVGEPQLPELWPPTSASAGCSTCDRYDLYVADGARAARWRRLEQPDRRVRLARCSNGSAPASSARCSPTRSLTSSPTTWSTGRAAILLSGGGPPVPPRPPVARRPGGAARVVPRRRAQLRPRVDARGPRSANRLQSLMVLAGGMQADKFDLDAFLTQAMEYQTGTTRATACAASSTRSTRPTRTRSARLPGDELGAERRLRPHRRRRVLPRRGARRSGKRPARRSNYYADASARSSRARRQRHQVGSQVGGVADQLADWIRSRGPGRR